MKDIRLKKKIRLSMLLLYILIALMYLYPVADLFPSAAQILVFIIWIATLRNKSVFSEGISLSWFSILIMLFTLISCICTGRLDMDYYSPFQSVIQRYQFAVYPIIFLYVSKQSKTDKYNIFHWCINCITITIIISLYYILAIDPQAIRNTIDVDYFGVGDFQLMYSIAIIVGPLLFCIINKFKNQEKCYSLLAKFTLMCICLVLCNLVTAVVLALCSIAVTYCITRKNKLMFVAIGLSCSAIILAKNLIGSVLKKIAAMGLFYWSTNNKIEAIGNVLMNNMTDIDTLSRRMMLSSQSIESFKQNPLFGIDFKEHGEGAIGCHAQWVDDLGRFGIIGNAAIWLNYLYVAKKTINYNSDPIVKLNMISVWICFVILGFLNPCLSGTILMAQFVIIPTLASISEKNIETNCTFLQTIGTSSDSDLNTK